MRLQIRKELLMRIQNRYKTARRNEKKKILDELIATTGYRRKYAINLLNQHKVDAASRENEKRLNKKKYQ